MSDVTVEVSVSKLWQIRDEGIARGRSDAVHEIADEIEEIAMGEAVVPDVPRWAKLFVERLRRFAEGGDL